MTINKILVTGSEGFVGKQKPIDVTNINQLLRIENVDAIVHLAAKTSISDSFKAPSETYFTNLVGTLNTLEFARIRKIEKFMYISTYVYGQPAYLPVDERHSANPHSPYNNSKLLAEKICQNYSYSFGIDTVTLRPFYIYGPNCRNRSLIPSIIKQIKKGDVVRLSGKKVKRDFLFVTDFVYLIEKILQTFPKGYNTYNVGYGKSYSLSQVTQILARLSGKKIEIEFSKTTKPDVSEMVADIRKVSGEFNWKPTIDIKEGLRLILQGSSI